MDKLDEVFKMFYYAICDMAKWVFAIRMASDIIKNGNESDIQGILKSVMQGGISYGALYSIVSVLESIQSKFNY